MLQIRGNVRKGGGSETQKKEDPRVVYGSGNLGQSAGKREKKNKSRRESTVGEPKGAIADYSFRKKNKNQNNEPEKKKKKTK